MATIGPARSRSLSILLVLGLAIPSVAPPRRARAQEQDLPTVDVLLEEGVQLREAGRDEEALRVFRRAWEMWPSPRTQAQLALACQAVGRWVEAAEHLSAALAATSDPWIARTRRPLEDALALVVARVGRLEIAGTVPDAEVRVGGRLAIFREGRPVFVEPGSSEIEVRAPGFVRVTLGIDVRAGEVVRARVRMQREPSAPSEVPGAPRVLAEIDSPPRRSRRARTERSGGLRWTWVALGTAAAFGGASLVSWVRAQDADDELASGCGATRACTMADIDDTGGPTLVTLANVFLAGAALSAAVGVLLLVLEWPRERRVRGLALDLRGLHLDASF